MKTFAQAVQNGEASLHEIDEWVEAWHDSSSEAELHETLGMDFDQYSRWVQSPDALAKILGMETPPDRDVREARLIIKHGVDESEQESSFMNATLVSGNRYGVSVAMTVPDDLLNLSDADFNERIRRDTQSLRDAGWEVEVQRGFNEDGLEKSVDRFVAMIEGD